MRRRRPARLCAVALASASVAVSVLAQPALARCREVTVSGKGVEKRPIDAAKASAMDALVAKIRADFGRAWGVGSHRYGSFRCDENLGYKGGWTCTARTSVICAP